MNKRFFDAIAIYVGTAVGAAVFAIPYAFAQAGFGIGFFYLLIFSLAILLVGLMYLEVVLKTPGDHQFTGCAQKYLGPVGKWLAVGALFFGVYSALTAYTIGVGTFLNNILGPYLGGNATVYGLIFFALAALALLFGLGTIATAERIMVVLLLLVIGIIVFTGAFNLNFDNYQYLNWKAFFVPYGIILFSLGACHSIPTMKRLLKSDKDKLRKAIIIGWAVPVVIYLLFGAVVLGINGSGTTEMAIDGLKSVLGNKIVVLGSIFGTLSMTTSFLALGFILKQIYKLDFKFSNFVAWLAVVMIPLLLFLLNWSSFITAIAAAGTVMVGLESLIIIAMWVKVRKLKSSKSQYSIKVPRLILYGLLTIFTVGLAYQVYYTLVKFL